MKLASRMHDEGMHVGIEIVLARAYYPRALHTRVCEHVQSRTLAEIISIAFSFRNQTAASVQLRGEIDLKSDALGCRRGGSRYNFVETLREERNGEPTGI